MKFKKGDRVRVVKKVFGAYSAVVGDIGTVKCTDLPFNGDLKIIVEFDKERKGNYHSCHGRTEPYRGYWCSEEMLEPVKNECILIYRKDNEVIALDKSTGKKAVAKCSPEDTFDFKTGAKLAFGRLTGDDKSKIDDTIKVGDIVTVVDDGTQYTVYDKFFEQNDINYNIAVRFAYGESIKNGGKYRVEAIGKHRGYIKPRMLCVIKDMTSFEGKCYLIDITGVKKC